MVSEPGQVLSNVELTEHGVSRSVNFAQYFWDYVPELYLPSPWQTEMSVIISHHMFAIIAAFPELTHMCASSLPSRMLRLAGNHIELQYRLAAGLVELWLCVHTDQLVWLCMSVWHQSLNRELFVLDIQHSNMHDQRS